ncbi:MAG TPA: DUF3368 domain-containing protein [Gammaproteobacteria bacterium]|nr:DUF3368 domain-containing protein [Gammaproteobacteria bacterium]
MTRQIFQLPEAIGTPNILYDEELASQHPELPALGLRIMNVEEDFMKLADQWQDSYPGPTFNDLTAMALAKQERCTLLTGDKGLRNAATHENIEVHGTLWLTKRLYSEKIIHHKRAEQAYTEMRLKNRRLPWDEVEKQLKRFRKDR